MGDRADRADAEYARKVDRARRFMETTSEENGR